LWIPSFGLLAKPFYTASQGALKKPLHPFKPILAHFTEFKEALLKAPALGLLDHSLPFCLYLHTNQNITLVLLSQDYGHTHIPYLSKQLDSVIQVWLTCLRTLGAAALLTSEAQKLFTLNQPITVLSIQNLQELTNHQALLTFSPTHIQQLRVLELFVSNPLSLSLYSATPLNSPLFPYSLHLSHLYPPLHGG
jgi:hypothetical protein